MTDQQKTKLSSYLRTDEGKFSSTRLLLIFGTLPFVLCVLVVWITVSLKTNALAEIPSSVTWTLGVLLGHAFGSKGFDFLKSRNGNGGG
jgi:hypothetical protein